MAFLFDGDTLVDATAAAADGVIEAVADVEARDWASVNEGTEGPPIWDVVESHIRKQGTVRVEPNTSVIVEGV